MASRLAKRFRLYALVLLCLGSATTHLFAHATLLQSEPSSGAVLEEAPRQVRLVFSEPIEAEFNGVAVYNSSGLRMDSATAAPDPKDVNAIQAAINNLPPDA